MSRRLNYFGFVLILLFVIATFFLMLINPNNLVAYNESEEHVDETEQYDFMTHDINELILNKNEILEQHLIDLRKENKITEEQSFMVFELKKQSIDNYKTHRDSLSDTNQINYSLYVSLWYVKKANFITNYYQFTNCVNKTFPLIRKYRPLFYFLTYTDKEKASSLQSNVATFIAHGELLKIKPGNVDKLIDHIKLIYNYEDKFNKLNEDCASFYNHISQDYKYQSNLFKIKIVSLLLSSLIIFLLAKIITWNRIRRMFNVSGNIYGNLFFPRRVSGDTIKTIIKLDSLITVIVSVTSFLINIFKFNLSFFIFSMLCVICLLFGIVIGVISINTPNNPNLRIDCYRLFMLGMILFVIILVEIIFLIQVSAIFTTIKQSVAVSLINSTII